MKTKLTLSIEPHVVELAHKQAARDHTSISELFSAFITTQAERDSLPTFEQMRGVLKQYDIDYSKEHIRALYSEKYLR